MNDLRIIELLRTGQSDMALNTLYRHYPMIRKLVRSGNVTTKDAEDVFQETLLVLLRKAADPQFQLTSKLSTYLYSVARYIWNDQQKKQKPHLDLPDPDTLLNIDPHSLHNPDTFYNPGLAAALESENRARLAERVITELQHRCRELLLLFYKGQLPLKAIAEKMGYSSENTAKNQKYKCLETARTRLQQLLTNPSTL
jgi:RNA polymerase sigma factor (sigma-70 family)